MLRAASSTGQRGLAAGMPRSLGAFRSGPDRSRSRLVSRTSSGHLTRTSILAGAAALAVAALGCGGGGGDDAAQAAEAAKKAAEQTATLMKEPAALIAGYRPYIAPWNDKEKYVPKKQPARERAAAAAANEMRHSAN